MIGPFLVFSLLGLGLFYFQNLALFPYIQLRLLGVLVFYVSLRPSFPLAFALAVALGLLQDSYALTPLGLHVSGALVLVALGRFARRRFLIASPAPQVLTSLAALGIQEAALRVILVLVGYRFILGGPVLGLRGVEIVFTALLAPLMFFLLRALEKAMRRRGWGLTSTAGSR
jgi:rod shape-determining protein MreD